MPLYSISAPDGNTYQIEGPEGATKEEVVAAILRRNPDAAKPKSITGYMLEAAKGIPRGLVGGLEQAAVGAAALLPEEYEKPVVEKAKALAQRVTPTASLSYAEAPTTKLAEALGSMGTFLVPGGIPARVAMAAAMGAGEARQRAQQAGATSEEVSRATALGVIPGLTDILPVERMVSRFGKGAVEGVVGRVAEVLKTGGLEAAQEAAQGYAQNLIAQNIYKPDQSPEENVAESAALGFGAGAIAQTLLDLVTHGRARLAPARTEPPAPSALPVPPEGEPPAPAATEEQPPVVRKKIETPQTAEDYASEIERLSNEKPKNKGHEKYIRNKIARYETELAKLQAAPEEAAPEAAAEETEKEVGKEEAAASSPSVVTNDVLNTLGVGKRNTKLRNQLRGLDLSNAEDRDTYDRVFADSKAKFNYEAVDNFIAPYRPEKPLADESVPVTPAAVDTGAGGRGVGESISEQAAGEPIVAGPLGGGVAVAGEPVGGVAGREEPSAAPVDLFGPIPTEVLESRKVEDREQALPEPKEAAVSPGQLGFFGPRGGVLKEAIPKTVEPPKAPKAPKAKKEPPSTTKPEIDASLAALDTNISQQEYEAHLDYLVREAAYAKTDKDGLYAKQKLEEAQIPKSDLEAAQQRAARFASREQAAARARIVTELEKLNDQLSEVKHDLKEAAASGEDTTDLRNQQDTVEAQLRDVSKEAKDLGISPKATRIERVHVRHIRTARKSVGEVGPPTGNSTDRVVKEIERIMRPGSGFERITTVVQTEAGLPEGVRESPDYRPGVRGVAYKGRIWLVADNIPQGRELGVFLHEAGAHLGFDQVMKPGDREHLARTVRNWAKGNDLKAQAAKIALAKGGESNDEIIAYTVEELVNRGVKPQGIRPENTWLTRVIAAYDRALKKLGLRKDLTAQELVDAAFGAAHIAVKAPGKTQEGPRFSTGNTALDEGVARRTEALTREGDLPLSRRILDTLTSPQARADFAMRFRVNVEDVAASVKDKLLKVGDTAPLLHLSLATRSSDTAVYSMLNGAITLDEQTQIFRVQKGTSLRNVHQQVQKIAARIDAKSGKERFETAKRVFDLGGTILRYRALPPEQQALYKLSDQDKAAGQAALDLYGEEIRAGMDAYTAYKNGLLDAAQKAGRFSAEDVTEWKKAADFVPWYRVLDDAKFGHETKSSARAFFSGLYESGKIRELTGGDLEERPIGDLLTNMEKLSYWMVNAAIKNHAANSAMNTLLQIDARQVGGPAAADRKRLVKLYQNGAETYFEVGNDLDTFAFMGAPDIAAPWVKVLASGGNFLRKGTTLMPGFVAGQIFQDSFRVMAYSGAKNPFAVGARVFSNFTKAVKGDALTEHLASMGIVGQIDYVVDAGRSRVQSQLREASSLPGKLLNAPISLLDRLTRASDEAARRAVYRQTQAEGGDEIEALYKASEIINFQRRGKSQLITFLRQVVPFTNAYIQGMSVALRTMAGQGISFSEKSQARRVFYANAAKISALSLIYAMLVSDDDQYKKLADYQKARGFMVPGTQELIKELTGSDPGNNVILPTPMDPAGVLFKYLPESIYNFVSKAGTKDEIDNTKFLRGLSNAAMQSIMPPGALPQVVKPAVELWTNYSFFTGNPIVGKGLQQRATELQFTDSTSEAAKWLGGLLPFAPVQIDYFMRGTFGLLGGTVMEAASTLMDSAVQGERPTARWNELPQIRSFLGGKASAGLKEDYYELRDKLTEVNTTVNYLMKEDPSKLPAYYEANKQLYALQRTGIINQAGEYLAKLREYRTAIVNNEHLTGEQKREKVDQIEKMEVLILSQLNLPALRKLAGL